MKGVKRGHKHIVMPFMMRMTYVQHALFPGAVQWLMTRTGYIKIERIGEVLLQSRIAQPLNWADTQHWAYVRDWGSPRDISRPR